MNLKTRFPGISGAVLKWLAVITMLIDHIGASVLARYRAVNQCPPKITEIYQVFRHIGRLSFPIFIFLLIEGFRHTKNRKRYLLRLLLFAFISEIPYDLAFSRTAFHFNDQNVYFTLFLGMLAVYLINTIQLKWRQQTMACITIKTYLCILVFAAACVVSYLLKTDYSYSGVSAIVVMYCARTYLAAPFLQQMGAGTASGNGSRKRANDGKKAAPQDVPKTDRTLPQRILDLIAMTLTVLVLLTSSMSEIYALFGLPAIFLYDGSRGRQSKYFFYLFYPVHLLLLWVVLKLMGIA